MSANSETKKNPSKVVYYRSFNQNKEADGILFQDNLNIVDHPLECYDMFHIHHHLESNGLVAEVEPDKNTKFLREGNGCAAGKQIVIKNFMPVDEFKMFLIKKLITVIEQPEILMTVKKNDILLLLQKRWPMFEIDEHGAFYADVSKYFDDQILGAQNQYSDARDNPETKIEELNELMNNFNKMTVTFNKSKKQVNADIRDLLCIFKLSQENSIASRVDLVYENNRLSAQTVPFNNYIYLDAVFYFAYFANNTEK